MCAVRRGLRAPHGAARLARPRVALAILPCLLHQFVPTDTASRRLPLPPPPAPYTFGAVPRGLRAQHGALHAHAWPLEGAVGACVVRHRRRHAGDGCGRLYGDVKIANLLPRRCAHYSLEEQRAVSHCLWLYRYRGPLHTIVPLITDSDGEFWGAGYEGAKHGRGFWVHPALAGCALERENNNSTSHIIIIFHTPQYPRIFPTSSYSDIEVRRV